MISTKWFVVCMALSAVLAGCNDRSPTTSKHGDAKAVGTGVFQSNESLAKAFWLRNPKDPVRNAQVSAVLHAIREKEEDPKARYASYNASGATGFTQVMPANIKAWSKQCLGVEMSREEYGGTPLAQILISHCEIGRLWDNYHDIRIVASCWFSGRTDYQASGTDWIITEKSDGTIEKLPGTPIKKYVTDVVANLARIRPDLANKLPDNPTEKKKCKW